MITIALCEDNEFQQTLMQNILDEYIRSKNISYTIFSGGEELLRHVRTVGGFDIYLLDVVMPGINGMEVATILRQMYENSFLIFLTSSLAYAAMSYDVDAFYYLTKPLDAAKLYRVLDKACARLNPTRDTMELRIHGGDVRLRKENVMYAELKNRAPIFHMTDGQIHEGVKLRGTFREIVSPLLDEPYFTEAGVGLVVNLHFVDALDSESMLLQNGKLLCIPKSCYPELKKAWRNFNR